MCRSIKQLRQAEYTPTNKEIEATALQFVRKMSGYRKPSRANEVTFDTAAAQIADSTRQLLDNLLTRNQSGKANESVNE